MGLLALAAALYAGMSAYFSWANKRRQHGLEDRKTEGLSAQEVEELGDEHPQYVYTF